MQVPNEFISPGESRLFSIESLLNHSLSIPQFQRPYDWESKQVKDLISDLSESQSKSIPLFLGLVVLHKDSNSYAIIDGQQRLTTLMFAIAALGGVDKVLRIKDGLNQPWVCPREKDVSYARSLMRFTPESPETLSQWRMASSFKNLSSAIDIKLETLLQCEVIVYVAPNLAGATRLFERINLRGKKVGEFDLVKNKLIEWVAITKDEQERLTLEKFITSRYDSLYTLLDPKAEDEPYDSDKLLKVHWILFNDSQFNSGDRVLDKLSTWLDSGMHSGLKLGTLIEQYLDSLVEVASTWVWIERPFVVSRPKFDKPLLKAMLNFEKLRRDGELQPLIVASIKRFGNKAVKLINFCEINSFRAALAKKNSNHGRSVKWRLARQLYNNSLVDAKGKLINTPEDVAHQLFWLNTPWWSKDEPPKFGEKLTTEMAASLVLPSDALDNPKFLSQYRSHIHYIFWKYGQYLLKANDWKDKVQVDINPFQESVWFNPKEDGFLSWDIEHIYPINPDDLDTKPGRAYRSLMEPWLNHIGNLTVLPIRDNRGMQNRSFKSKLEWMLDQKKVPFNELLSDKNYTGKLMNTPHWGPFNCKKRLDRIREFANIEWGSHAIQRLGVAAYDDRIKGYESDDDDGPEQI